MWASVRCFLSNLVQPDRFQEVHQFRLFRTRQTREIMETGKEIKITEMAPALKAGSCFYGLSVEFKWVLLLQYAEMLTCPSTARLQLMHQRWNVTLTEFQDCCSGPPAPSLFLLTSVRRAADCSREQVYRLRSQQSSDVGPWRPSWNFLGLSQTRRLSPQQECVKRSSALRLCGDFIVVTTSSTL